MINPFSVKTFIIGDVVYDVWTTLLSVEIMLTKKIAGHTVDNLALRYSKTPTVGLATVVILTYLSSLKYHLQTLNDDSAPHCPAEKGTLSHRFFFFFQASVSSWPASASPYHLFFVIDWIARGSRCCITSGASVYIIIML